ncbi:hypothetical protein P9J64_12920 [Deltaproteobacteria bacterium IMCC39524]|nr:hypothetical protein [Deltaproteobacteria bacterium IMCC39524]
MKFSNVLLKTSFLDRWLLIKHSKNFVQPDSLAQFLKLYTARFVATLLTATIWVAFTLTTGIFTVGIVILLGVAIGVAHFPLRQKPHRFHLLGALLLTIAGGMLCNVLAGLAFFSSKMGVSYWQVLVTNLSMENMQMLGGIFVQSVRPEDLLYYMAATTAVLFFAQYSYFYGLKPSQSIEVQLRNGKEYHVCLSALDALLSLGRVARFKRSDGWAVVGRDPLRTGGNTTSKNGIDRRLSI